MITILSYLVSTPYRRIYTIYTLAFYLLPFLFISFRIGNASLLASYSYRPAVGPVSIFLVTALVIFLFVLPESLKLKSKHLSALFLFLYKAFYGRIFILLFAVWCILAVYAYFNITISFRHSGQELSSNNLILLFSLLTLYVQPYVLYLCYLFALGCNYSFRSNAVPIVCLFFFLKSLTITASFDILALFFAFGAVFFLLSRRVSRRTSISPSSFLRFIAKNRLVAIFILPACVLLVVATGMLNKYKLGDDGLISSFLSLADYSFNVDNIEVRPFDLLINRVSVYLISLQGLFDGYDHSQYSFLSEIRTLWFRIFGESPDIATDFWSINRFNFLVSYVDDSNPRTGASPGPLASAFVAPLFLSLPILFVYFSFVRTFVSSLFTHLSNPPLALSVYLYIMAFYFFYSFCQAPFSLLNLANTPFIGFVYTVTAFFPLWSSARVRC
jgi:hypothetical protein